MQRASNSLASELVFSGDAGTTEAGRPSHRYGVEFANYYAPRTWLVFDGDVSWSGARFTDGDPVGPYVPGAAQTVISAGATVEHLHRLSASVRLRYFGPRPLIEVEMADAWVWDMYRKTRFVPRVKVITFKDVNVEELPSAEL